MSTKIKYQLKCTFKRDGKLQDEKIDGDCDSFVLLATKYVGDSNIIGLVISGRDSSQIHAELTDIELFKIWVCMANVLAADDSDLSGTEKEIIGQVVDAMNCALQPLDMSAPRREEMN